MDDISDVSFPGSAGFNAEDDLHALFEEENRVLVLDGILDESLLDELRWYALTTPVDTRYVYNGGYNTVDFDKENYPITALKTIVEGLQENLSMLHGKTFDRGWLFIYENECAGVTPHADPASINVNIWVTPDHCVKDPSKNGLIVYDKKRPEDWSWEDYNKDLDKIRKYLSDSNAQMRHIEYKCNRAVVFDSSYFHETNDVSMLPGGYNRRINFTFMFV